MNIIQHLEIGTILETITGIAEQTNLLALNALIEAAEDIKVIVSNIQNKSSNAVHIMDEVQTRTSDQSTAEAEEVTTSVIQQGNSIEEVADYAKVLNSMDEN